ncbi:AAA family ATPase [Nocardia sp. NBC_01503]|uniref:BTAD domain-containing putative transcriptional regulator n=1 Tax=Nocardia sp. NBC_01503 TaxID=2975997 RepID=UPI002E7BD20E|nr:BTAD domain-containing putative transcriptional regulator [Nocardia sp. NBC_01503]WTL36050.1 AAA family ATPase [Nocardia sp. NBC_01503]
MTKPQVHVFGPLQVMLGGRTARIGAGRQQAILGRLVLAGGRTLGVDRLVEDVWEGSPPPHAPSALQVQIHNLRRVLEPTRRPRTPAQILVSEGSGYALRLDSGNVDAWQFETLMRQYEERVHDSAEHPGPVERYRILGEALDCWHGAAFESFADASWAASEVSRLTDLHASAIEMRAQAALELDRFGEVVTALRRQIEEFPGREETARLLALAQYRLGQQIDALATVRRTREFLRTEYGIDSGSRLNELESAILSQSVAADQRAERSPATVSVHDDRAPEVSNARERSRRVPVPRSDQQPGTSCYPAQFAAMASAAREARSAGLRLIWLVGDIGAGKTTLASMVSTNLAAAGWVTVSGRCPEVDGAPPAWPWSEVLAGLGGGQSVPDDRLETVDPFTIVRAVSLRCRELARNGPAVIVLEDVHRADNATLQVLCQLVTWLQCEPVLIVVTARDSELPPRVRATEAMLADRITERLELTGSDLSGTRQIARDAGLVSIDCDTVRTLHERTGGNPLFIREISKFIAVRGDRRSMPTSIRAVLIERIERLPVVVRTVLQHIAVWGNTIDLETLTGFSATPEEVLVDCIEAATRVGLVRFDEDGRIELCHVLAQEVLYDSVSPLRRQRMHCAAMEFLEAHGPGRSLGAGDPRLLARHAFRGATRATAPAALEYVTSAALHCDRAGERRDAAELWRAAVDLHELAGRAGESGDRQDGVALLDALCALTDALAYDGHAAEARITRERALDLAETLDSRELVIKALTCWRAPVIWSIRDWRCPDARIRLALESAVAEAATAPERARLLIALVYESEVEGDVPRMYERACEAVDLARDTDQPELLCAALGALAFTVTGPAMLPGWRTIADELLRAARSARLFEYQALAHYLRFRVACRAADVAAARLHAACAFECASTAQARPLLDMLSSFSAVTAVLCGDLDAAEAGYRQFGVRTARSGIANESEMLLLGELVVAWARGDISELSDRLGALYTVEPELVAQVYVVALLHAGERERARALFQRHPRVRSDFYRQLMTVFRAHAAVALGAVEEAGELYDALAPAAGTLIGFDSGVAVFGPMDAVLADLSELRGDAKAAARLRTRAHARLIRARSELDGGEEPMEPSRCLPSEAVAG